MTIKELLTTCGYVAGDNVNEGKLETELAKMFDSGDTIPKSRFQEVLTQRNEATAKVVELETEKTANDTKLAEATTKLEASKNLQTELDTFKTAETSKLKAEHESKIAELFTLKEDDKRFEKFAKVKGDFIFNAEGNYSTEELKSNLKTFGFLEKTGYLTAKIDPTPNLTPAGGKVPINADTYDPFNLDKK